MFDFTIVPDDGSPSFVVTAGMRDIVMWEKTHRGRSFGELAQDGLTATALYEIAYSACRRQQLVGRETSEQQFIAANEIELMTTAPATEPSEPDAPPVVVDDSDPFDGFAVGHATVPAHAADEPADPTRSGA